MHEDKLRQVVEALIFGTDHALPLQELTASLENVSEADVRAAIERLNREYEETGRAFMIREQAGGLRFVTRPEYHVHLSNLFKGRRKARLSRAALETLSIIAYKQPVSRAVIEAIRGVNIDGVVTTLLERNMITIAGRSDGPGRPLLYKTTGEFLDYFGLKNLGDLPNLREIKELFQEGEVFKNLPDEVVLEPPEESTSGESEEIDIFASPDDEADDTSGEEAGTAGDEWDDETDDDFLDAGDEPDEEIEDSDTFDGDEPDDDPADDADIALPDSDNSAGEETGVSGHPADDDSRPDDSTVKTGHDHSETDDGPDDETGSGNPA